MTAENRPRPAGTSAGSLMTVAEAARRLGLSSKSIYRAIRAGDLVAHRFGRACRISPADLDRFLRDSRT